ncbi:cholinesterase 1-like [Cydia pomonella]|uniref:cholinesterase 1-like n=1 Tax=Cydia pomonella TaxID=82600 RepID=UPI002ADE48BE|nr:cholinesterase 1-like [Cydia pomonella]
MLSTKWLVLWSLWAARLARQPSAPLRVGSGLLRGSIAHDGSHIAYLGIPYATVARENRFKAPGPEAKWDGTFEADRDHIRCLQRLDISTDFFSGQEDCLTLNVYTPLTSTHLLPVMVFIHGGAYIEGSGSPALYGPRNLVSKSVILVTINYRLNVQGFLCLGIKEAPGNAGIKDQVAALKWIQRNIRAFGGDPDNITIFGESAGASSVSYHLLSPMSKGLFHKAIMQSGSSLAPWAYQPSPVQIAASLAKVMGNESEDPHDLYNFYSKKTDIELVAPRIPRQHGRSILSELLASPCVEKEIEGVEAFLTEEPYELLSRGEFTKMPLMIGTTSEEGYFFTSFENSTTLSGMDFSKAFPCNLQFPTEEKQLEVACRFKEMYMGNDTISKQTLEKLSKFHGEPFFVYPVVKETELILNNTDQPVFSFVFDYAGWKNVPKAWAGFGTASGATHGDELFYLFEQLLIPNMFEWRMMEKMSTLWTNFAKFGNPTPEASQLLPLIWPPTNLSIPEAFVIDNEPSTRPLWSSNSLKYWNEVYTKYRSH